MKIRVQRQDDLWEVVELPHEPWNRELEEVNCIFAGPLMNLYFDRDGYFMYAGRSLESMTATSVEEAERQVAAMEESRKVQDILDADLLTGG
jgi:hypothetical protein